MGLQGTPSVVHASCVTPNHTMSDNVTVDRQRSVVSKQADKQSDAPPKNRVTIGTQITLLGFITLLALMMTLARRYGRTMARIIAGQPSLTALFGASALSVGTAGLYTLGLQIYHSLRPALIASITVENSDASFDTILEFIAKQGICSTGDKRAITHKRKNMTIREKISEWSMGRQTAPTLDYRPDGGDALTVFEWEGKHIYMTRSKGQVVTTGYDRRPTTIEKLRLQTFGMDDSVLRRFLDKAMETSFEVDRENLNVWVMADSWWGSWEKAMSKRPRSVDSVVLDGSLSEDLIRDARSFFTKSDWYVQAGIPYRRGYLLYGPPGCGKTSFCQALAGALRQDLCMLTLANKSLDDTKLARVIRDTPVGAIILLEDVDSVFINRDVVAKSNGDASGVTFSGLLNAIDGVASQEGRLFLMTTNHIEKLDPALIRPGRFDVKVELGLATKQQMQSLFLRFFPAETTKAVDFAASLPEGELSMAQLQGHLLQHKDSGQEALSTVPSLLEDAKPSQITADISIYEHLRRVGLENYASLFEYYGFSSRSDLAALEGDVKVIRTWDPIVFKSASPDREKLERLLTPAAAAAGRKAGLQRDIDAEYELAELSSIKERFLQYHLHVNCEKKQQRTEYLHALSRRLCDTLSFKGKSQISVGQLEAHLRLYSHDPELTVQHSSQMISPRPDGSRQWHWMTSYEWLRRLCLERHADALEAKGIILAKQMLSLDKEKLKDLGLSNDEAEAAHAVLTDSEHRQDAVVSFQLPSRHRVQQEVTTFFPTASADDVRCFAESVTDNMGRGLCSLAQIERHLRNHSHDSNLSESNTHENGLQSATQAAVNVLIKPDRLKCAVMPQAPTPTQWVHRWLDSEGMGQYSANFIEQDLCTEDDLATEPMLNAGDLSRVLGIKKLGHCRKVSAMIEQLVKQRKENEVSPKRCQTETHSNQNCRDEKNSTHPPASHPLTGTHNCLASDTTPCH